MLGLGYLKEQLTMLLFDIHSSFNFRFLLFFFLFCKIIFTAPPCTGRGTAAPMLQISAWVNSNSVRQVAALMFLFPVPYLQNRRRQELNFTEESVRTSIIYPSLNKKICIWLLDCFDYGLDKE